MQNKLTDEQLKIWVENHPRLQPLPKNIQIDLITEAINLSINPVDSNKDFVSSPSLELEALINDFHEARSLAMFETEQSK